LVERNSRSAAVYLEFVEFPNSIQTYQMAIRLIVITKVDQDATDAQN